MRDQPSQTLIASDGRRVVSPLLAETRREQAANICTRLGIAMASTRPCGELPEEPEAGSGLVNSIANHSRG
jgi:hypothetical protein